MFFIPSIYIQKNIVLFAEHHSFIGLNTFFRYLTVHTSGTFLKQKEGFIISHVTLKATFI